MARRASTHKERPPISVGCRVRALKGTRKTQTGQVKKIIDGGEECVVLWDASRAEEEYPVAHLKVLRKVKLSVAIRRLLALASPEKPTLAVAFGALLTSAASNLLFPSLVGGILDRVTTEAQAAEQRQSKSVFARLIHFANLDLSKMQFKQMLMVCAAFSTVGAMASWLRTYTLGLATARISRRLRKRLFRATITKDLSAFESDDTNTSNIVADLTNNADILATACTTHLADLLRGCNSAFGASYMLLRLSPQLTAATLGIVPVFGVSAMLMAKLKKRQADTKEHLIANANAHALERVSQIRLVKQFAREGFEQETYNNLMDQTVAASSRAASGHGQFMATTLAVTHASIFTVLGYGGCLVQRGKMTHGNLTEFLFYAGMVGMGFAQLAGVMRNVSKAVSDAESIFEILDAAQDDPLEGECTPEIIASVGACGAQIDIKHVDLCYPSRPNEPVLTDFSLQLRIGTSTALVGPNGCGKSSVAALLAGLYRPSSGQIEINGFDIYATPGASRYLSGAVVGMVDQEPTLFKGSIADNIRYGTLDASEDEIISAAKTANAHDFITNLAEGYETNVGERGILLSGGQRQRIVIARAIVRNPALLILDEATSSLDANSARVVQTALDKIVHGSGRRTRTVLTITHRLDSLDAFDNVVVMSSGGTVVTSGPFDDADVQSALASIRAGCA